MSRCRRNDWRGLVAAAGAVCATALGQTQGALQAGAWFPPSPCDPGLPVVVAVLGGHALMRVRDRPDAPPHDAAIHHGLDGGWYVPLQEWQLWTHEPPPAVQDDGAGGREVPLSASSHLAWRMDQCTAELWVDADPRRRQDLSLAPGGQRQPLTPAGTGGFLNLDAEYGGLAGGGALSGLFDLGEFSPAGAGRSGFLASRDGGYRLDSDWIRDDPEQARRLRLGDAVSDAAEWETAVRFAGVQWGRDFALQPDRITFPLPSIAGSAAVPSTAQLYVNGQPLGQQALQPGQFTLTSVPVLTGAGELSVVVRDATGREHSVTQAFYASPRLLAAGLDAYTAEGGFLREGYAGPDDRYTSPFAAGGYQLGFDDQLTGLLRGSASQQRQLAGQEWDWLAGTLGVVTAEGAAAHTEAGFGSLVGLGFERTGEVFSLSLRRRFASRGYGDLGRDPGTLHFSDAARISWNSGATGTASLVYINEKPWDAPGVRLAGLSYSVQPMRAVNAYLSWLHPLDGSSRSGGGDNVVAGLSISFGRTTGGTEWDRSAGHSGPREYAQHSPPGTLGLSWYASADQAPSGVRQAEATWVGERGSVGAGWVDSPQGSNPSASLQTGVALLDGRAFWTRPVQDSFAVVDTGGIAGVRVYRENQLVGVTDSRGSLLVPDLLPYQVNRLGVDDRDLPITLGVQDGSSQVVAPFDSGVPVHFAIDSAPSLRLTLLDEQGHPVPAGAALTLDGAPLPLPVGYGGLVYLSAATGRHRLAAAWTGGNCEAGLSISGSRAQLRPCRR